MREVLAASGQGGLFSQKQESITIQVAREGELPWYIWDADDSKRLPVGADDLTGRFINLEIQDREFKGRPTSVLILRVASGSQVARLRIGSVVWGGDKEFSGSVKTFLEHLDRIPDQDLKNRELKFMPYAGRDEKVSLVAIIDPQTGKSFPKIQEDQDNWHNELYWKGLLEKAIARINNPVIEGTRSQPSPPSSKPKTAAPTPVRSPLHQQPPARTGKSVHLVGTLQFKGDELVQWQDEENPRVTRSSLYLFIRRDDGELTPCSFLDRLAVKLFSMYHPNQRVDCTGTTEVDSNGKEYVLVDTLDPFVTDDSVDFDALIAESDRLMVQAGWTNQEGRDHLLTTYKKTSRKKLSAEELQGFISHLRGLAAPTTA
jgi:hypothetical protein